MKARFLSWLVVGLSLTVSCADTTGPANDPAGTYDLVSVSGLRPPAPFFQVEIVSGSVTLHRDASYHVSSTVRGPDDLGELVTQTSSEMGTYLHTASTIRFTSDAGRETVAAYDGRTLRVDEGGHLLVYRRQ